MVPRDPYEGQGETPSGFNGRQLRYDEGLDTDARRTTMGRSEEGHRRGWGSQGLRFEAVLALKPEAAVLVHRVEEQFQFGY